MFAVRAPAAARPVALARPARRAARVVARAAPNANKTPLEAAIEEAKETCEGGSSGECAVAWDTVRGRGLRVGGGARAPREGWLRGVCCRGAGAPPLPPPVPAGGA